MRKNSHIPDSTIMKESNGMHILKSHRLILSFLLIFYGCEVGTRLQGQSYLHQEKYSEGVEAFREKLKQNSFDPAANYYMGRYLLALNQSKKAYPYLKKPLPWISKMPIITSG
jgi:tetratricopeptide (TPR) repeat protein